jgi:MFS family permease
MGPILGAVINARVGWRWIFWFLAILAGTCLGLIYLTLPETARTVVGNGGIPAHGIHAVPFKRMVGKPCAIESIESFNLSTRKRWQVPNPLTCLKVLLLKDSALVILVLGIVYMTYACLQASLSTLFIQIYGFDYLQAGLIYIPFGLGCALMAWSAGCSPLITRSNNLSDAL